MTVQELIDFLSAVEDKGRTRKLTSREREGYR